MLIGRPKKETCIIVLACFATVLVTGSSLAFAMGYPEGSVKIESVNRRAAPPVTAPDVEAIPPNPANKNLERI
jgi:hypothetical protein